MTVPTQKNWETEYPECLDYQSAYKSFFGITKKEAYALFKRNALFYQEELNAMPVVPFVYYLEPFHDYLRSEDSKEDSDGASSYLSLLKWKIEEEPEFLEKVLHDMIEVARYISENQS